MADIPAPPSIQQPRSRTCQEELAALLRLAVPLVGANLLQMAISAVDVIFVARLGAYDLAAATLGSFLFNLLSYALIGQDDIRRAVTRSYKDLVYFRIADGGSIIVLCIRHGAQRPRFPADGD